MASIIDDIITNTSVTAQTGNAISTKHSRTRWFQVRQELMRHLLQLILKTKLIL